MASRILPTAVLPRTVCRTTSCSEGPDIGVGNRSVRYLIDAQARYVAALVAETAARECTRIEVKRHIQEQYDRLLEWNSRGTASSWRRTRKPVTSDYEFTRVDAHEENDDYRGPARLIGADGETIDVQVHILATYEPTENRVRWFGRVAPADELPGLHTRANQPVLLQIADNDPVKGCWSTRTRGEGHASSGTAPTRIHRNSTWRSRAVQLD